MRDLTAGRRRTPAPALNAQARGVPAGVAGEGSPPTPRVPRWLLGRVVV